MKNKYAITYPDGRGSRSIPSRLPQVQQAIASSPEKPSVPQTKIITLPCYGIRIEDENGKVTVTSCLAATYVPLRTLAYETVRKHKEWYTAKMETIEALVASHYKAGVKVSGKAYVAGIEDLVSDLRK